MYLLEKVDKYYLRLENVYFPEYNHFLNFIKKKRLCNDNIVVKVLPKNLNG